MTKGQIVHQRCNAKHPEFLQKMKFFGKCLVKDAISFFGFEVERSGKKYRVISGNRPQRDANYRSFFTIYGDAYFIIVDGYVLAFDLIGDAMDMSELR